MSRPKTLRLVFTLLLALLAFTPAPLAAEDEGESAAPLDLTAAAIVHISVRALADARTGPQLGARREGSGIVIDDAGHILTIGYLVIEAGSVEITTADGRTLPATVAGYDHSSGFAVLRALAPLGIRPLALGASERVGERDPVLVVPHGGLTAARLAFVVSRRSFTGSWEYLLESAIFTTPPIRNWAGSALIDREGTLVGVGSLLVGDSAESEPPMAGNLFVPVDLLKPILAELIRSGRAPGPARPWLGLAAEELHGHLLVSRVSPEGPAERAGIRRGDVVVGVGGEPVRTQAELYRKVWARGPAGIGVPLHVLQGVEVRELKIDSVDRLDYLRRPPSH
jgi:S1-C subfamily serine protease